MPAAVPAFFAGLQVSAAYAMLGAVIAEWMGASQGLGIFLTRAQTSFRLDRVFVGIAAIALVSVALFLVVRLANHHSRTDAWTGARGCALHQRTDQTLSLIHISEPTRPY